MDKLCHCEHNARHHKRVAGVLTFCVLCPCRLFDSRVEVAPGIWGERVRV